MWVTYHAKGWKPCCFRPLMRIDADVTSNVALVVRMKWPKTACPAADRVAACCARCCCRTRPIFSNVFRSATIWRRTVPASGFEHGHLPFRPQSGALPGCDTLSALARLSTGGNPRFRSLRQTSACPREQFTVLHITHNPTDRQWSMGNHCFSDGRPKKLLRHTIDLREPTLDHRLLIKKWLQYESISRQRVPKSCKRQLDRL